MSDNRVGHNFIVPGQVNDLNEVYGMHISALKLPPHWYHAVALFKILDAKCAQAVRDGHAKDIEHNLAIKYIVSRAQFMSSMTINILQQLFTCKR